MLHEELLEQAYTLAERTHDEFIKELLRRLEQSVSRPTTLQLTNELKPWWCRKCDKLLPEYIQAKITAHHLRVIDAPMSRRNNAEIAATEARQRFHQTTCTCGRGVKPKWNKSPSQLKKQPPPPPKTGRRGRYSQTARASLTTSSPTTYRAC